MTAQPAPKKEVDGIIDRLAALTDAHDRQAWIRTHPDANWDEVIRALTERVWSQVRVDTHQADQLADLAVEIAEARGIAISLAKALRAKANALYVLDQHSAALQFHERAAALFEQEGDQHELARTLSGSIQPLLLLGQYKQAMAAGERARAIFQRENNTRRLARLEINIGNVYHRQDRFSEALAFYERAYRQLIADDDAEGLAAVLSNLSLCYISLNEFAKALDMHRVARRYCEQKGMPILVAYADYNIAYLHFLRGKYGRAIGMLRDASLSAKKAEDAYQLALCNLDLSEIYLELNLSSDAAELGRSAHEDFQKLGFGYEGAKALAFTAIAVSRTGQAFEAVKLFTTVREMFVRDQNQVWPSLIDLYEALVLFNEGRLFEARRLATAAHNFFRTSAMPGKAVLADLLLARIALRLSDTTLARQHCDNALAVVNGIESPTLHYQAELLKGELERVVNNAAAAYEAYRRAREAVERLRGSLRGEELKIAFFENKLEVYESLVDLCLSRPNSLEEAFEYIEHAKSRALIDLMNRRVHMGDSDDAGQSELVRSIRNLREELNWYYNLIEREQLRPEQSSHERVKRLEEEARCRESNLMQVLKEATIAEANEAGLHLPSTVAIDEIRSALPADAAIIEYFRIQDRIVTSVLTRNTLDIRPITLQSRIQKRLQLLQFQMSKFRLDPKYTSSFSETLLEATNAHLHALYVELIAPLRDMLDMKHLVFVPHGLLHYVPFHALHDGTSHLIDRYLVSYAPSASVFAICQTKHATKHSQSLILCVPDENTPSIRTEVEALADIIPNPHLFIGDQATEQVLRSHGPSSRIVHIATHGYFRQDNPMFSSIKLGTSRLNLYDVYHMNLPAELIVLSGCSTGLNVVTAGEELLGLVRGFLQAGAQSLLLSLWDVHDASTCEFMVDFYSNIQKGQSHAEALQASMVTVRSQHPHPFHWAPFSLIGKA